MTGPGGHVFKLDNPQGKIAEALGMSLGEGLGSGINTYYANKALDEVINDKSLSNAPISTRMGVLQTKMAKYGEYGEKVFNKRMELEKQGEVERQQGRLEKEQEVLGRIASGEDVEKEDLKHVSPQNLLKVNEVRQKKQFGKNVRDSLIKAGYPQETAELWQNQIENAPVGGQSDVIKKVNNLIDRSKAGKGLVGQKEEKEVLKPSIEIPGIGGEALELDFPELPEPIGLTPADIVKQNEHREKTNVPMHSEAVKHVNALDEQFRDIQYLQELETTGKLPTGLEKWNVDWTTGDLKFKGLANPEAQAYVKTIARMARNAKEFFPGRVTNFDLDQFKAGFATLANTSEGRVLINQQLALANRINFLENETLKASVEHYGSGADPILIKKEATKNYRKLKGQLENQLRSVNERAQEMINSQGNEQEKEKPPISEATTLEDIWS